MKIFGPFRSVSKGGTIYLGVCKRLYSEGTLKAGALEPYPVNTGHISPIRPGIDDSEQGRSDCSLLPYNETADSWLASA